MNWYEKKKHDVRFWLLRRLPPCKETVHVISQSMERSLSLRERVLLKLHVWVCMWCQWYMEHLQLLRDSLRVKGERTSEEQFPAASLSEEARARIKEKISGM